MRQIFIVFFLVIGFQQIHAQNRANTWYFGYGAGLDFNSGAPVPLLDGQLNTKEGCASISDNSGNLLFYTDGSTVYNRSHSIMQNGTGLKGHISSTHSAIIIPVIGSFDSYYIFTVDVGDGTNGLQYSVVDMSLDGGLGGITSKNDMLYNRVTEKVVAYKKSFSDEFWVMTQRYKSNDFLAYNITASGITPAPIISSVGAFNTPERRQSGQIKFSLDGKRLALSNGWEVQVFDFDEDTGKVTKPITLLQNINTYGIELSPNGEILYVNGWQNVYQFDLTAGSETDIANSMTVLKTSSGESFGSLQLGPDGKIYGVKVRKEYLDVIHNPDSLGTACDYRYDNLYLDGEQGFLGLPTFISNIYSLKGNIASKNFCHGDATEFTFSSSEPLTSISWDFGDGNTSNLENPIHTYATSGNYTVSVMVTAASVTKTETKDITIYPSPIANTIADFTLCSLEANPKADLSVKDAEILGSQSALDFSIAYYPTLADAQNGTNGLPTLYTNTNSTETITARISNLNSPSCFDTASFNLIVEEAPLLNPVTNWTVCDTDSDGLYDFELTQKDSEILNGQSAATFSVSYHITQTDADDNINAIGPIYTNSTSPETIFFRIQNSAHPECFETGNFNIRVITVVTASAPANMVACDIDNDGIFSFDLSSQDNFILNGQSTGSFNVTYHTSQSNADSGTGALNATNYSSTTPNLQTIFARVQNKGNSACSATTHFDLVVHDSPVLQAVTDWGVCDDDNDGFRSFDLTEKDTEILGGQSPVDFTVTYHETRADADMGTNVIVGTFQNTANPQTMFYRIENNANSECYVADNFVLQVFDKPIAATPSPIVNCDENETGTLIFDLSGKDSEVLNGQDPKTFTVSYFTSQNDALNNANPLDKKAYSNRQVQENIYARINNRNRADCFDTTEFEIRIKPLPQADLEETYVICPDSSELVIDGGDFQSWSWRDGNGTEIETDRYLDITELGEYTLSVAQTSNGIACEKTVAFEVVSSGAPEYFTTKIGNPSDKVTIIVTATGTGDFEYSTDGDNFQDSNRLEVFPGEHTVYVRDRFLCRTISKEVIALGYQKFFTPNGDGIHDNWNIIGADLYPESQLYIYDRYGKLLQQISPMTAGWDGSFNGLPLHSADYWFRYIFDRGKVFTGHFSLKR